MDVTVTVAEKHLFIQIRNCRIGTVYTCIHYIVYTGIYVGILPGIYSNVLRSTVIPILLLLGMYRYEDTTMLHSCLLLLHIVSGNSFLPSFNQFV